MDHRYSDIKVWIQKYYSKKVKSIKLLAGYDNLNFQVQLENEEQYVFKKHNAVTTRDQIEAECRMLTILAERFPGRFPTPVPNTNGDFAFEVNGQICRLLTWLDGDFLANERSSGELMASFGTFMANTDLFLQNIQEPAIAGRQIEWDIQHFLNLKSKVDTISNPEIKKRVEYFLLLFKEQVLPVLPHLRKSIIHNDANDWNVLVQDHKVTGLIDFGDVVHAPIIQEVAVALTYGIMKESDPIQGAIPFLKAYHEVIPFEEREIDVLYFLIAARLCLSLIHSFDAENKGLADDYILVSQRPAIDLLKKWITISPDRAFHLFSTALDIEVPEATNYNLEFKKRHQHIGQVLSVSYQNPIKMVRAVFQYMFDADGNTFLDAYNNIPHVGHQHPRVVEAGQRQMTLLNTNTRYLYDQLSAYAEQLLSKFPKPLNKVFFVNSGSEASDLAIRMAQNYTGHKQVAVLEHGYHGNTRMGIDISHYKFAGKGGSGPADFISVLPIPDTYRGKYRTDNSSAGKAYVTQAKDILESTGNALAAFIAEPIVGCGGQVPLAEDYLKFLYPEIRRKGGLCISDEVQTGFGRLGNYFWGFEMHGVVPDMVVLGKPMGNGHPLGAVVTTDEIADAFNNGMEFFSSFGGNPVSCAIGKAVLDVIEEENLQQNALETGTYFMHELRKMQKDFPQIGDVRGSGLFIGIDLVADPITRKPHTKLAQTLKNKLREKYILVSTDGPFDNVIKMKPPLCFNIKNVDEVINTMKVLLQVYYSEQ